VPTLVTTASIYLILTTVLTQVSGAIEHRLDVEQRH
jgi:polar amino acid transport system permease protein